MTRVTKAVLVERGAEQLDEAKRLVAGGSEHSLELAEVRIGIANAYARLADALGDAAFMEHSGPNW